MTRLWEVTELPRRHDGKPDGGRQHDKLRDEERRLRLRRRQRLERIDPAEALYDQHENVEPLSDRGGDDENPVPHADEAKHITSKHREQQHDERQDTDDDSRCHLLEWKAESGQAGQDREQQEPGHPGSRRRPAAMATRTTNPETIPIRLMRTWIVV